MSKVIANLTVTLDGYAAGEEQSAERPFGTIVAERLHSWMFDHRDESAEEIAAIRRGRRVRGGAQYVRP